MIQWIFGNFVGLVLAGFLLMFLVPLGNLRANMERNGGSVPFDELAFMVVGAVGFLSVLTYSVVATRSPEEQKLLDAKKRERARALIREGKADRLTDDQVDSLSPPIVFDDEEQAAKDAELIAAGKKASYLVGVVLVAVIAGLAWYIYSGFSTPRLSR